MWICKEGEEKGERNSNIRDAETFKNAVQYFWKYADIIFKIKEIAITLKFYFLEEIEQFILHSHEILDTSLSINSFL